MMMGRNALRLKLVIKEREAMRPVFLTFSRSRAAILMIVPDRGSWNMQAQLSLCERAVPLLEFSTHIVLYSWCCSRGEAIQALYFDPDLFVCSISPPNSKSFHIFALEVLILSL